jgi:hypothetical protein
VVVVVVGGTPVPAVVIVGDEGTGGTADVVVDGDAAGEEDDNDVIIDVDSGAEWLGVPFDDDSRAFSAAVGSDDRFIDDDGRRDAVAPLTNGRGLGVAADGVCVRCCCCGCGCCAPLEGWPAGVEGDGACVVAVAKVGEVVALAAAASTVARGLTRYRCSRPLCTSAHCV